MYSISVITICFNNLPDLIQTCDSVDLQKLKPFQHIIIDGSTNNEIKGYLQKKALNNYREWISEPDNGIADAFNKGIRIATGEIVVMLNSGDLFYNDSVIETVTTAFSKEPQISWLHGKYRLMRGGISVIIGKPFEKRKLYRGMRSVSHQTMFVKKQLHEKYGLYGTTEKISMDYDFLCRIADEAFAFLPVPLITFAPAGTSTVHYLQSLRDAKTVYTRYFGKSIFLTLWQLRLRILYYVLHSPVGNFLYKIKTKLKLENM